MQCFRISAVVAISLSASIAPAQEPAGFLNRVAVPIRDVDHPARDPFQRSFRIEMPPFGTTGQFTFVVPAGKRLVIEQVSIQASVANLGGTIDRMSCSISVTANAGEAHLFFALNAARRLGTDEILIGNQQVRAYADAGTTVTTLCAREGSSRSVSAQTSIIGHLVTQQ